MQELQRLLIERACEVLVIEYALHLDHKRADAFAGLFTEDAHFRHARYAEPMIGRARIGQWIADYAPDTLVRHVTANIRVDVIDADHARGTSYSTAYRVAGHDGTLPAPLAGPYCVVEYDDRYQRTAGGWKFAYRSFFYVFRSD